MVNLITYLNKKRKKKRNKKKKRKEGGMFRENVAKNAWAAGRMGSGVGENAVVIISSVSGAPVVQATPGPHEVAHLERISPVRSLAKQTVRAKAQEWKRANMHTLLGLQNLIETSLSFSAKVPMSEDYR